jgi:uncharacterized metal-binding protein
MSILVNFAFNWPHNDRPRVSETSTSGFFTFFTSGKTTEEFLHSLSEIVSGKLKDLYTIPGS